MKRELNYIEFVKWDEYHKYIHTFHDATRKKIGKNMYLYKGMFTITQTNRYDDEEPAYESKGFAIKARNIVHLKKQLKKIKF